jgi:hypothetical protein
MDLKSIVEIVANEDGCAATLAPSFGREYMLD